MKKIFTLIIAAIIIISSINVFAISTFEETKNTTSNSEIIITTQNSTIKNQFNGTLNIGKKEVKLPNTFRPQYVSDFMQIYPEIQVVSFTIENKTTGYINAMGGIGENFILEPEKKYEFITTKEVIIQIE